MKILLTLFAGAVVTGMETHSNFNPELNPAADEYAREARDVINENVGDSWSDRRNSGFSRFFLILS